MPAPEVFAAPLAFNVVPRIGATLEDGGTDEEVKMGRETRKILGVPDLEVVRTCVRVPVARARGVAPTLWFDHPVDLARAPGPGGGVGSPLGRTPHAVRGEREGRRLGRPTPGRSVRGARPDPLCGWQLGS